MFKCGWRGGDISSFPSLCLENDSSAQGQCFVNREKQMKRRFSGASGVRTVSALQSTDLISLSLPGHPPKHLLFSYYASVELVSPQAKYQHV